MDLVLDMPAFYEAGGKLTGKIENAAEGLTVQVDTSGKAWAWNPIAGEWHLLHKLKSGDTLWSLAGKYYGANQRWKEIRDVPQNKPIVGSDGADAFAGETLLIPSLASPFGAPTTPQAEPLPPAPTSPGLPWAPTPTAPPEEPSAVPVSYTPETVSATTAIVPAEKKEAPPFWTPGRIAVAAGAGALGVGLIAYFALRKPKRRNPRRRRRAA